MTTTIWTRIKIVKPTSWNLSTGMKSFIMTFNTIYVQSCFFS